MANVYAVKSGNWNDPTVWNTGALPTTADTAWPNGFNVTVDGAVSVGSVASYSAPAPIANHGGFFLANGSALTVVGAVLPGYGGTIVFSLPAGESATLIFGQFNGSPSAGYNPVRVNNVGTLNLVGNIIAGLANQYHVQCTAAATVNLTGNAAGPALYSNSSGTKFNVVGSLSGSNGIAVSNGTLSVVGNISGENYIGASASSIDHTGTATASATAAAIYCTGTAIVSGPFINTSGQMAVYAPKVFLKSGPPISWQFTTQDLLTDRTLYTADQLPGVPSAANVRHGTAFGPANELTGSCRIPPASAVASGVPVDAGTGTAVFDPAAVWEQLTASMATSGSIGERLKNAATVQSVGDQWAEG